MVGNPGVRCLPFLSWLSLHSTPDMYTPIILLALLSGCLAQSAFKCPNNKNSYYPDSVQCDLYYHCEGGEAEEKLCPDGLVFDETNSSKELCDNPTNVDCGERTELQEPQRTDGCPRANGYFRHSDPNECVKFVNCIDGVPQEVPCPPGLIYDDDAGCAWPAEATRKDCINTKRDVLDDGFSCPEGDVTGPNGRVLPHPTFPHPEECQKFYICRNGVIPQHGSCSGGQVYNEDIFKCDEPENVPGCENWFKDEDKRKP